MTVGLHRLRRPDHVLHVADLDRSAAFHGGKLGLELARDQGACLIKRVAGPGFLGLCSHRPRVE
jgi:hypothetical protein